MILQIRDGRGAVPVSSSGLSRSWSSAQPSTSSAWAPAGPSEQPGPAEQPGPGRVLGGGKGATAPNAGLAGAWGKGGQAAAAAVWLLPWLPRATVAGTAARPWLAHKP